PAAAPPIPFRPSVRVPHFDLPPPRIEVPRFEVPKLEPAVPGLDLDPTHEDVFKGLREKYEDVFKGLREKYPDLNIDEMFPRKKPLREILKKNVPPGEIAHAPQAPYWKTWQSLPPRVPDTGIVLAKGRLTGELAPEHYPNIRIKNVDS